MAYMIDPMALKYYDSTGSNSTVIKAQSFGSYTVQFVNCNLILFLILSSYNCVIGASPRLLFINCPMTGETTAKSIMSPPSFSTPYLAHASLPWFFLVTHTHTRTYVQTHHIRLGCFSHLDLQADMKIHYLNYLLHIQGSREKSYFYEVRGGTLTRAFWSPSQVLCQLIMCFEITWSLTLNEKDATVGLSPRGRCARELEKRCVDFRGRCESLLEEHSQLPAPGLVLGYSDAGGPIEVLLF